MAGINRTITMTATKTEKLANRIYDAAHGFSAASKAADDFIVRMERLAQVADKFNGKIKLSIDTSAYDKIARDLAKTEEKRIKIIEEFDRPMSEAIATSAKQWPPNADNSRFQRGYADDAIERMQREQESLERAARRFEAADYKRNFTQMDFVDEKMASFENAISGQDFEGANASLSAMQEKLASINAEIAQMQSEEWDMGSGLGKSLLNDVRLLEDEISAAQNMMKGAFPGGQEFGNAMKAASNPMDSIVGGMNKTDKSAKRVLSSTQSMGAGFRMIYQVQRMLNGSVDGFADALGGSSSTIQGIAEGTIEASGAMGGMVTKGAQVMTGLSAMAPILFGVQLAWQGINALVDYNKKKVEEANEASRALVESFSSTHNQLIETADKYNSIATNKAYFSFHAPEMNDFFDGKKWRSGIDSARSAAKTLNKELGLTGETLKTVTSRADLLAYYNDDDASGIAQRMINAYRDPSVDSAKDVAHMLGLNEADTEALVQQAAKAGEKSGKKQGKEQVKAYREALDVAFNDKDYNIFGEDFTESILSAAEQLEQAQARMTERFAENAKIAEALEGMFNSKMYNPSDEMLDSIGEQMKGWADLENTAYDFLSASQTAETVAKRAGYDYDIDQKIEAALASREDWRMRGVNVDILKETRDPVLAQKYEFNPAESQSAQVASIVNADDLGILDMVNQELAEAAHNGDTFTTAVAMARAEMKSLGASAEEMANFEAMFFALEQTGMRMAVDITRNLGMVGYEVKQSQLLLAALETAYGDVGAAAWVMASDTSGAMGSVSSIISRNVNASIADLTRLTMKFANVMSVVSAGKSIVESTVGNHVAKISADAIAANAAKEAALSGSAGLNLDDYSTNSGGGGGKAIKTVEESPEWINLMHEMQGAQSVQRLVAVNNFVDVSANQEVNNNGLSIDEIADQLGDKIADSLETVPIVQSYGSSFQTKDA